MQVNTSGHDRPVVTYHRISQLAVPAAQTKIFYSPILIKFHSVTTASTKIDISHEVVL
jgi:hypothetical protein